MPGYLFRRPGSNTAPWRWPLGGVPPSDAAPAEALPPGGQVLATPQRAPLRAASVAYVVLLATFPVLQEAMPADVVVPSRAPAARRAAPSAYWLDNRLAVPEILPACTVATSPGTVANDAGTGTLAWTNPSNAGASDDSYATAVTRK